MESRYPPTRFQDYSHAQLVAMLQAGNVAQTAATGSRWRDVANLLDGMAVALEQQHRTAAALWEGPAAQAHERMVATLIDGLRHIAFTARRLGDAVLTAAEALRRAQERMASLPPPVEVQPPDEPVLVAASTRVRGERWAETAARQAQAIRAIQEYRRAQAAAATVTTAAVQIMEDLRRDYCAIDLPALPAVEQPPVLGPDGRLAFATPAPRGQSRLLDGLWRNGLIATAGIPPAQVLPAVRGPEILAPDPRVAVPPPDPGVAAPPAPVLDLGSPGVGDLGAPPVFGGELPPIPSIGGPEDGPPAPVVGSAPVIAAGPKNGPVPPAMGGMPFFPPMMGGMVPPTQGAGDLGRADKPWLTQEFEGVKGVNIEVVPDSIDI